MRHGHRMYTTMRGWPPRRAPCGVCSGHPLKSRELAFSPRGCLSSRRRAAQDNGKPTFSAQFRSAAAAAAAATSVSHGRASSSRCPLLLRQPRCGTAAVVAYRSSPLSADRGTVLLCVCVCVPRFLSSCVVGKRNKRRNRDEHIETEVSRKDGAVAGARRRKFVLGTV